METVGEKTKETAKTVGKKTKETAETVGEKTKVTGETVARKTKETVDGTGEKAAETIKRRTTNPRKRRQSESANRGRTADRSRVKLAGTEPDALTTQRR